MVASPLRRWGARKPIDPGGAMGRICAFAGLFSLLLTGAAAGVDLGDYLPSGTSYDPSIPTPKSVLGYEVGEWHVRHDQLVRYLEAVSASSDRVTLEVQGQTHESRPLLLLTITSPDNHRRLEEIRQEHLAVGDPARPAPAPEQLAGMPVVVWLGYSVHGNEASGSNASLLVAYHLAAARGSEIERLLSEAVILIDPSLNPDGLGRFAEWANMHRGKHPVGEPSHREHREAWPGGRTNHYWFDLNRDWLLLQQPENRARVGTFHRWKPNLSGDYHEMGRAATYFFQPGVPSRENPLIPAANLELTRRIARYHADALDREGRLYFTEETFDDYYPGKGSTYPDLNGGVGVLFEQASARGHLIDTSNGSLSFPQAITNQFLTSLSMLRAAREMRGELLAYQAEFFRGALSEARSDSVQAYVFSTPGDPVRAFHMLEILTGHRIEVYSLAEEVELAGRTYEPGSAFVVPVQQPQYRLVECLFERRTEFAETTFYDVSAWTLPLAFGATYGALGKKEYDGGLLGTKLGSPSFPRGAPPGDSTAYAYLFDWNGYYAPRALYRLLRAGVRARVATLPFEAETGRGRRAFDHGTIVVPTGPQQDTDADLADLMGEIAERDGIDVFRVPTGLTASGVDLGSPKVRPLEEPKPLLVVGRGVSGYEAGEVWQLLDHRFDIPLPLVELDRFDQTDLRDYTHLLLVDGDYSTLEEPAVESLRRWVGQGGTVVATKRAAEWAGESLLKPEEPESAGPAPDEEPTEEGKAEAPEGEEQPEEPGRPERAVYAEFEKERAAQLVTGAILAVDLDTTHPVAFGFRAAEELPVFRNSTLLLEPSENQYENVALYADPPLRSGYVSQENLDKLRGTAAVIATRVGDGAVVRIIDNPNFRAFWYGTNKLYLNAIFFGPVIKRTSLPDR